MCAESIAINCAKSDALLIRRMAENVESNDLLIDGSQYSPSYRALTGGAEVWNRVPDKMETYAEELDTLIAGVAFWESGDLFAL